MIFLPKNKIKSQILTLMELQIVCEFETLHQRLRSVGVALEPLTCTNRVVGGREKEKPLERSVLRLVELYLARLVAHAWALWALALGGDCRLTFRRSSD